MTIFIPDWISPYPDSKCISNFGIYQFNYLYLIYSSKKNNKFYLPIRTTQAAIIILVKYVDT